MVLLGGTVVGLVVGVGCSATIHSPVRVHLLPLSMIFPLYLTMALILVKVISQPASHKDTTDRRECAARPGMMYPVFARFGRSGRFNLHWWVERTLLPSGKVTLICAAASCRIVAGALVIRKWLVAPESRIAHW